MRTTLRTRFWIELGLAATTALFFALTLLWKDWIEIVFRVDPDGGSGSLEWAIAAVSLAAASAFSALARLEWRRAAPAGSH
jgi:hypothetical protein